MIQKLTPTKVAAAAPDRDEPQPPVEQDVLADAMNGAHDHGDHCGLNAEECGPPRRSLDRQPRIGPAQREHQG
jgi:hypothetical protein